LAAQGEEAGDEEGGVDQGGDEEAERASALTAAGASARLVLK
jgi:hypothetical protein